MDPSSDPTQVGSDWQALVSARADAFHAALARGGAAADWGPFLDGLTGPARGAVLAELVVIDLSHRWKRGDRTLLESYLARYPELGPTDRVPLVLIREEIRCRTQVGDRADPEEYRTRFPVQFPQLQELLGTGGGDTKTVVRADLSRPVSAPVPTPAIDPDRTEAVVSVAQQYDLVRQLGRGTFGEVWLARKHPSGIEKAVKVLHQPADQDTAKRELRSLELIKNLRHPYLLATEDFWVGGNKLYIVTELADGSLRGRLKECQAAGLGGVPLDELLVYVRESAEGLDYLHTSQITHRDVKPDNILVVNRHAKVADFGLVRRQEQAVEAVSFAGTPAFMAPEIWLGEGGPASDQYALAVTYVELRQGKTPFAFGTDGVMMAHVEGRFTFDDTVPEAERLVLRKAMARNPGDRYPSCTAFSVALADALNRAVVRYDPEYRDTRPPPAPPPPAPPRRPRWFVPAAATLGVVLAAGVWFGFFAGKGGGPRAGENAVPAGAEPEAGAALVTLVDGRQAPEWVVLTRGSEAARFRLVAPTGGPGTPAPFYIAAAKVWNQFHQEGCRVAQLTDPVREQPGGPTAPAVNLTANQAAAFAAALGGRLPTPDEWDHAAGFHERQGLAGPLRAGGTARVGIAVPGPATGPDAEKTANALGLLDLAGNGREWTAAVLPGRGQPPKVVDGATFPDRARVILRGRSYTYRTPLTFADMEFERDEPQTQFANVAGPFTGFRVVLPVP
jgi:hypothetical protein